MDFYPAKNNDRLNRHTFSPESVAGRVMVNPRYPVRQLTKAPPWWCERCGALHTFPRVRCDSGAFQDIGAKAGRMFPWPALSAQLRFEEQLRWWIGDPTFHFETIFIYDDPAGVDEALVDGKKIKIRGTEESAAIAIKNTIDAARYYASQRKHIQGAIGWVGQGIDADQYVGCVKAMLPLMQADDVFAFGGFCILGRMPARMTETFRETVGRVMPLVRDVVGITEYHLLGVMYAPGVIWADALAGHLGVSLATDGSGPEQAACIGGRGYLDGCQVDLGWKKEHKYEEYHPCALAMQNIQSYSDWATGLSSQSISARS